MKIDAVKAVLKGIYEILLLFSKYFCKILIKFNVDDHLTAFSSCEFCENRCRERYTIAKRGKCNFVHIFCIFFTRLRYSPVGGVHESLLSVTAFKMGTTNTVLHLEA
jgi:hypothetical protein